MKPPSQESGSPFRVTWDAWTGPGLDDWRAWTPEQAAAILSGFDRPWCVVGGWAADLAHGCMTREHEDLEIAILAADFPAMRDYLRDYRLYTVGDGHVTLQADERDQRPPDTHQNWVLDERARAWRMDVMVEPGDENAWVFRRDQRVTAPRAWMVEWTPVRVPYLRLHGMLLYKAKHAREKDQLDFLRAWPSLAADERAWLADSLALVHPGHPWLSRLAANQQPMAE